MGWRQLQSGAGKLPEVNPLRNRLRGFLPVKFSVRAYHALGLNPSGISIFTVSPDCTIT
jgi:hypothetical protein